MEQNPRKATADLASKLEPEELTGFTLDAKLSDSDNDRSARRTSPGAIPAAEGEAGDADDPDAFLSPAELRCIRDLSGNTITTTIITPRARTEPAENLNASSSDSMSALSKKVFG